MLCTTGDDVIKWKGVIWAESEKYIQILSENLMGRGSLRAQAYIRDNINIYISKK
jgi:hypothetical protein